MLKVEYHAIVSTLELLTDSFLIQIMLAQQIVQMLIDLYLLFHLLDI